MTNQVENSYRYNIRGWLKSINNAQLTTGTNNDDANDYFGMELDYNTDAGISNTPYYNGNISAIKWKGFGAASGTGDQRSYKYSYDKSDRMKDAIFQANTGSAWTKETNTLNESLKHDHNGNILSLVRKQLQRNVSGTVTAQSMDDLTYTYGSGQGNKLKKVEDGIATTVGMGDFKNTATDNNEFDYDTDGNLKKDLNKGISNITYNLIGKAQQITFSSGDVINYTYDASGRKLAMAVTKGGNTVTTNYVNEFVYNGTALTFFGSPEGRVVKNGSAMEYQYAIGDHQGNTRVVFSTAPAPASTYTATFEDNTQSSESTTFQNYPTGGNRSSLEWFDHTDFSGATYNKSQLLTGGYNSQVGLAKSLKVYPGDVIHAEVYAKYWNATSTTSNISGFAAALTSAFNLSSGGTGEALKAFTAVNDYGAAVAAMGGSGTSGAPKAFITVLLFDQNYNFVDVAFDQIGTNGEQNTGGPKSAFDLLSRDVTVREPGYAFIFVSNENPTEVSVYFDDVSITHTKSNVIQYNEYYPFGLQTSRSWTRENTTGNNFLANSSTELNVSTGYYDLFFRNFDPALGRFMQVDPLATRYHNQTTYQFGNNDPVYWSDPSGAAGDAWSKNADGDFFALNSIGGGGGSGMFGSSYNMATYGSPGGVGGATGTGGFGTNYNGQWKKIEDGGTAYYHPVSHEMSWETNYKWVFVPDATSNQNGRRSDPMPGMFEVENFWDTYLGQDIKKLQHTVSEKSSTAASSILSVITTVGTSIAQNYYMFFKEGVHEGTPKPENKLDWAGTYRLDNWTLQHRSFDKAIDQQEAYQYMKETTDVILTFIPSPPITVGSPSFQKFAPYVVSFGSKAAIKSGRDVILDPK